MKAFMMSTDKHRGFWFRIYGYGISCINREIYKPLFSVRNGFVKEYRVGKYGVKFLKRSDMREFRK